MAAAPVPGTSGMPLLDTVKQNSAAMSSATSASAQQAGLGATGGAGTQQLASLMGTAQSGKEATPAIGGQAQMSAVAERLAGMNTLMAANQVQQGSVMQSEAQIQQAQAQQQQYAGQLATLSQEKLNAQQQYQNQVSGMLQQASDQFQSMVNSDNKSRVEQMGTLLRLGNEQYIQQLNTKATEANLQNQAAFQNALNTSVFANETDLLGQSLTFRNYMAADQRQSTSILAGMDLNFAIQVAMTENKSAGATMMWSGIGTAGAAGAVGVAKYSDKSGEGNPEGWEGGEETGQETTAMDDSDIASMGAAEQNVAVPAMNDVEPDIAEDVAEAAV